MTRWRRSIVKNEMLTEFRQSDLWKRGRTVCSRDPEALALTSICAAVLSFHRQSTRVNQSCALGVCYRDLTDIHSFIFWIDRHKNDFEHHFDEIQRLYKIVLLLIQGRFKTGIHFDVMGVVTLYHDNHIYQQNTIVTSYCLYRKKM